MPKELSASYIAEVYEGLNAVFNMALQEKKDDYTKVAMQTRVSVPSVNYLWLSDLAGLKEWIGDREFTALSASEYAIKKKNWQEAIKVDRDVLIYDNLGIVKPLVESLADAVQRHYNELIFGLLEKNERCYDGKNFFASDHPVGSSTMSNLTNKPLSLESFMEARKEMRSVSNSSGKRIGVVPNLLVVPPELESVALNILKAQNLSNGASNIAYNLCELFVSNDLNDPDAWYLLDTTRPVKPLILQINKDADFVSLDKPDSYQNFMRREYVYGVDAEHNAGYGLWQLAYKSSGKE